MNKVSDSQGDPVGGGSGDKHKAKFILFSPTQQSDGNAGLGTVGLRQGMVQLMLAPYFQLAFFPLGVLGLFSPLMRVPHLFRQR